MFLDKFRNRYSFNFLTFYHFIFFILYLEIYLYHVILEGFENAFGLIPVFFVFFTIPAFIIYLIGLFIYFLIYVTENLFTKKIVHPKFLNNKFINKLQVFGFIHFICISIVLFFILIILIF